jgi:hypothetical protein
MTALLHLSITSQRDAEQLADLTRELLLDLRQLGNVEVGQVTRPPRAGEKADAVPILGQLVLAFLSSGAAKALLDCLRPYFERDRTMTISVEQEGGSKVIITGKDLRTAKAAELLRTIQGMTAQGQPK